jgi:hypothetical protein
VIDIDVYLVVMTHSEELEDSLVFQAGVIPMREAMRSLEGQDGIAGFTIPFEIVWVNRGLVWFKRRHQNLIHACRIGGEPIDLQPGAPSPPGYVGDGA